jgi:hypothetical protein
MGIIRHLGMPILVIGLLLIVVGTMFFLNGPTGPPKMVTINSRQFPIYDFTVPFLALGIALVGFGLVLGTFLIGSPLVVLFGRYQQGIENLVSGFDDASDQHIAKMFFVVFGIMLSGCFVFMGILLSNPSPIPHIVQSLLFDTIVRIGLFMMFVVLITMFACFLIIGSLDAALSGIVLRVTGTMRTPTLARINDLAITLFYRQLRSKASLFADLSALTLAFLAFFVVPSLQIPLLVAGVSVWGFALGKDTFIAFQRASVMMGEKPMIAIKSVKMRGYLSFASHAWAAVILVMTWKALLSLLLPPVSDLLSRGAPINRISDVPPIGNTFAEVTGAIINYMTGIISNYLIFILFIVATVGLSYSIVFPAYFFRKSNRAFLRKLILAVAVFGVSLSSQIIVEYFTPSYPSLEYSSIIFLLAVLIIQFLQRSYEEAMEFE